MAHRFVVVMPLDALRVGESFSLSRWPLHVTIVPAFTTATPATEIARALRGVAATEAPLSATVGPPELFGPRHNLSVNVLLDDIRLAALHRRVIEAVPTAVFDRPEFTGAAYRPHITATRMGRSEAGSQVLLTQFALVDMQPQPETGWRAVVEAIALAQPA